MAHLQRKLPNDDAANYAVTALQIARQFNQGHWLNNCDTQCSGWRPTAFAAFLSFFLLRAAMGGCLRRFSFGDLRSPHIYIYRLARMFSADPLVAAATTAPLFLCRSSFHTRSFSSLNRLGCYFPSRVLPPTS
jgi:hypothetical protein